MFGRWKAHIPAQMLIQMFKFDIGPAKRALQKHNRKCGHQFEQAVRLQNCVKRNQQCWLADRNIPFHESNTSAKRTGPSC